MIIQMPEVQHIASITTIIQFMEIVWFTKCRLHMLKMVQQLWKANGVTPLSATAQIIDF